MKNLKKKSLLSSLPAILFLFILAALFLIPVAPGIASLFAGPADLDTLDYDGNLDGVYAKGTMYVIYDWYCDTKEDNKVTSREYIIDAGDTYYMGMLVPASGINRAEGLMNAYWDYIDHIADGIEDDGAAVFAAQYEVSGTIVQMPSDSRELYYDFLTEAGYILTEEDKELFLPYYLEINSIGGSTHSNIIIFLLLSVVFIAAAVIILVGALTGAYQKQIKQYIAKSANPESAAAHVESFLAATEKDGPIRYNNEFFCGLSGSTTVFQEIRDLVWAYQKTVTHKRNFITVGHSYYIVLGFRNGSRQELKMKNEAETSKYLTIFERELPAVIVGYNDDLDKLFKNAMNDFLEIKYNNQAAAGIFVQK